MSRQTPPHTANCKGATLYSPLHLFCSQSYFNYSIHRKTVDCIIWILVHRRAREDLNIYPTDFNRVLNLTEVGPRTRAGVYTRFSIAFQSRLPPSPVSRQNIRRLPAPLSMFSSRATHGRESKQSKSNYLQTSAIENHSTRRLFSRRMMRRG